MFYCIPAWYVTHRHWGDVTDVFYRGQLRLEFDDTIHQFKTLCATKEQAQLVILNYAPQLRHFLYRQKLENETYYSVFDTLQNITAMHEKPFNVDAIDWPKGADFIFSPFLIVVLVQGEKFAQVEFTPDGNIYFIDFFENNERNIRYYIDDRGFISSTIVFKNGQAQYQDYLNEAGVWQIREYLLPDNQKVYINPVAAHRFKQKVYVTMTELITEKMHDYFSVTQSNDTVMIASSPQHNNILLTTCAHMNCLLSFFDKRYECDDEQLIADVQRATGILTDSLFHYTRVVSVLPVEQYDKVLHITPYDARFSLGKSQRIKELIIVYYDVDISQTKQMMAIFETLYKNMPLIRLKIIVKEPYRMELYRQQAKVVNERLQKNNQLDALFYDIEEVVTTMYDIDELITIVEGYSELSIVEVVETARLVIDLSVSPNVFLQIASISAGVPQINVIQTPYVSHLENGYIIHDETELVIAIQYYFVGLSNWNKALVHSVRFIQENSGESLIKKWKGLIQKYGKAN